MYYSNITNKTVFVALSSLAATLLFSALVFCLTRCFSWYFSWSDCVTNYWLASLQAVGPIVAIWGAFYVGKIQADAALEAVDKEHHMNVRSKEISALSTVEVAHQYFGEIVDFLYRVTSDNPSVGGWVYSKDAVDCMMNAINDIKPCDLVSRETIDAFIKYKIEAQIFVRSIERYVECEMAVSAYRVVIITHYEIMKEKYGKICGDWVEKNIDLLG